MKTNKEKEKNKSSKDIFENLLKSKCFHTEIQSKNKELLIKS